ncbi:MAG: hypothetical protein KH415_11240 [Clostridium sp.]|nr:hypothetical protein [Clostridium sp.]
MISREEIQEKVDIIKEKFEKNKVIPYYIFTSFFLIGILFFFSSNLIFNKEMAYKSTSINEEIVLKSVKGFTLKDRKYNPTTGLIQLTLKVNRKDINNDLGVTFELRERKNPTELLECEVSKVTNTDYIITSNIKYNWDTISLTIVEDSEKEYKESIKFYSNKNDVVEDSELRIKSKNEYVLEVIDNEIKDINSRIDEINLEIDNKINRQKNEKEFINLLNEEMEYQTELEIEESKSKISSSETSIQNLESEINILNENIKELENKINKLEEKKQNFR